MRYSLILSIFATSQIVASSAGKRVGTQFYRLDAAEELFRSTSGAKCPETGKSVLKAKVEPSILEDPKGWFWACDAGGDRKLSRDEVVSTLKAQLPPDNHSIERFRSDASAWQSWDKDGSGFIEYAEIMDEDQGLLKFVHDSYGRIADDRPVPDLRKDREARYRHRDEDNLVVRAMAKSFSITTGEANPWAMDYAILWS